MVSKLQLFALLGTVLLSAFTACKPLKSDNSGITGTVTWIEGNQMPMVLEEGQKPPKASLKPIKRKIQVFPLMKISDMKMENGLFVSVMEKPLAETESDNKGKFTLELAPGQYSIFTVEEEGLFANVFDGEGNVMPVTVREKEWTLIDIEVNYKAVY
jgi:hypothetical protein